MATPASTTALRLPGNLSFAAGGMAARLPHGCVRQVVDPDLGWHGSETGGSSVRWPKWQDGDAEQPVHG